MGLALVDAMTGCGFIGSVCESGLTLYKNSDSLLVVKYKTLNIMTISELSQKYQETLATGKSEEFNYVYFNVELVKALQEAYNLNYSQACYVVNGAYSRYHNCYGDIFYGAAEIADFCVKFSQI